MHIFDAQVISQAQTTALQLLSTPGAEKSLILLPTTSLFWITLTLYQPRGFSNVIVQKTYVSS